MKHPGIRFPATSAALAYLSGLVAPVPRLVSFVASERKRNGDELPRAKLTPGFVAAAAMDEWTVAFMKTPGRLPTIDGAARAAAETLLAYEVYRERGWLDDPASMHTAPPPPDRLRVRRVRAPAFEHLSFESGYEPDPNDPSRARWLGHERNRTAHAWMLRHPGKPRPWIVCLHAYGMGYAPVDLWGFRATWLHRTLGLNVLMPIAPLHGPRRVGRLSGTAFVTYNLLDLVHGFAQGIWDVRRLLAWIREQGGQTVGVYGGSMGAHLAAMLAGIEPDLAAVIAAFPTSDLSELFFVHGPRKMLARAESAGLSGDEALAVHKLVTPLALPARVPRERLFLCAGLADRMAMPAQALLLWEHWDRPRIEWFNANHVSFLWSREVGTFLRDVLESSGLTA